MKKIIALILVFSLVISISPTSIAFTADEIENCKCDIILIIFVMPDYYEQLVNTGELRLGNGVPIYGNGSPLWGNENATPLSWADTDNQDSDGDILMDGEELIVKYSPVTGKVYIKMLSNPCLVDSDGDALLDGEDPHPMAPWDLEIHGVGAKAARKILKDIAYSQYPWLHYSLLSPALYAIVEYRIYASIKRVEKNKEIINSAAKKYGVPGKIIGGIIFKEQLTQSLPDAVANIDTFLRKEYHSTGLGAIFPSTARAAWGFVDSNMVNGLSDIDLQYKLTYDNEFNIETIAAVLLYEAEKEGLIEILSESKRLTQEQWKDAVVRYNGTGNAAIEYAQKVYEYLDYTKELLRREGGK